eukprot:GGOE01018309.1.p1 GENE.GGOE01018309.1~~GGOE01018309.1.p1  ORF type:complete len:432 (-),score=48.45 GGOE01018309.1:233-1486(-)
MAALDNVEVALKNLEALLGRGLVTAAEYQSRRERLLDGFLMQTSKVEFPAQNQGMQKPQAPAPVVYEPSYEPPLPPYEEEAPYESVPPVLQAPSRPYQPAPIPTTPFLGNSINQPPAPSKAGLVQTARPPQPYRPAPGPFDRPTRPYQPADDPPQPRGPPQPRFVSNQPRPAFTASLPAMRPLAPVHIPTNRPGPVTVQRPTAPRFRPYNDAPRMAVIQPTPQRPAYVPTPFLKNTPKHEHHPNRQMMITVRPIPDDTTEDMVAEAFSVVGGIARIEIHRADGEDVNYTYAEVTFTTPVMASTASTSKHVVLGGVKCRVTLNNSILPPRATAPNPSLAIFNMPPETTAQQFEAQFSGLPGFVSAEWLKYEGRRAGQPRGFGVITFQTTEQATEARRHLRGQVYEGYLLQVNFSRTAS